MISLCRDEMGNMMGICSDQYVLCTWVCNLGNARDGFLYERER